MSEYVTDPELLKKLNETEYVKDPELLKKLNSSQATPVAPDNSQYKDAGISTFAANAVNALTFGLPEYLNKTLTPATYAEGQKYQEANPLAANLGTATGEVAGFAIPAVGGAVKGAQLGVRGAEALAAKYGPALAAKFGPQVANIARGYGGLQGSITGATMGAQAGAALPGVVQGDPGQAVAAPSLINQYANKIPMINHLGALTGNIVPAAAAGAATATQSLRDKMRALAASKVIGPQQ